MEQVSKGMMKELNLAGEVSQPIDLEKIINNHNFSIDTPEVKKWYENEGFSGTKSKELQLKLIKHIWLNDPQFEAEKPKKYVVQSKKIDGGGDYWYVVNTDRTFYTFHYAYSPMAKIVVKFDTREEAEKWTNPLMEVVEVEE